MLEDFSYLLKYSTVMYQNNEHFLFGDFPENVHYFDTARLEIFQKVFVILIQKSVHYPKKSQLNLLKYVHKYIYCILKLCFYHFESDRRFLKKKFCDEKFCDEKVFIILGQPVLRFSKKCSLFWDKKVFIILGHHCTM